MRALCIGANHPNAPRAVMDAWKIAVAMDTTGYTSDVWAPRSSETLLCMGTPEPDVVSYSCEARDLDGRIDLYLGMEWVEVGRLLLGRQLTVFDCCHVGRLLTAGTTSVGAHRCLCAGAGKTVNETYGSVFTDAFVNSVTPGKRPYWPAITERIEARVEKWRKANSWAYEQKPVLGWLDSLALVAPVGREVP